MFGHVEPSLKRGVDGQEHRSSRIPGHDDDATTRPGDANEFAKGDPWVGDVAEHTGTPSRVERPVVEGKVFQ